MEEKSATEAVEEAVPMQTDAGSDGSYSFPVEAQTEHWEVDFSDSKQVYEGMSLPVWILAGWAVFIIWAVIYLTAGVRTTF